MSYYRCFFLDAQHRVLSVEILDTGRVEEAIERGHALLAIRTPIAAAFELWSGTAKIYPSVGRRDAVDTVVRLHVGATRAPARVFGRRLRAAAPPSAIDHRHAELLRGVHDLNAGRARHVSPQVARECVERGLIEELDGGRYRLTRKGEQALWAAETQG